MHYKVLKVLQFWKRWNLEPKMFGAARFSWETSTREYHGSKKKSWQQTSTTSIFTASEATETYSTSMESYKPDLLKKLMLNDPKAF